MARIELRPVCSVCGDWIMTDELSLGYCRRCGILFDEPPERKHGYWKGYTQSRYFGNGDDGEPIFHDGYFYVCSECRRKTVVKTQFCPQCGAKMDEEVKQDES